MPQPTEPHDQRPRSRYLSASDPRSSELTHSELQLFTLCHQIEHGYIEDLVVRGGQPVLDPEPRIMRDIRLKGSLGPRESSLPGDFVLKTQMVELIRHLEETGNGLIRRLDVQGGLPFRILLEGLGSYAVHVLAPPEGPQSDGR